MRLGHHELLIRLASGGAANVFLVRDLTAPDPGRLLALKILLPSLASNEDFVNMFFAEAKIARSLRHPNVVTIAGFGLVDGIHCLAMEYVFGASLAQVLRASAKARKPLTVGVLLRITACVCDALHYAHQLEDEGGQPLNLVHRDVTPQNILIGFNGVPKLTDFGIAKATNRGWETQAGIVKGKFSYMSPEQALGKKVDRRSDIFGTGIVLWEALTGRDLFRGSTPMEVLSAIRNQKIEPPSKVVPGLTPIVDPIVMKALRRSPRQRYQTAAEMRDEIEDLIRRAGVDIDSQLISREFAAIYGNDIAERALALRQAMSGRGELEHLAEVLGGSVLNPKHLPVITGGMNDPDPLGLFGDVPAPAFEVEPEPPPGPALPARNDQSFSNGAMPPPVPSEEFEIIEEEEPQFEVDLSPSLTPDVPDERLVSGWDDSTAMSVPDDELLSMISEEDATIGYLPPELAERFGLELQKALDGEGSGDFDDEMTVGMPEGPALAQLRALKGDDHISGSTPWDDPQRTNKVRSAKTESLRPVPRAPSVLMEEEEIFGKGRPFPRAPSLDMEGDDRTPLPPVETAVTRARSAMGGAPKQITSSPRSISTGPARALSTPPVPSLQLEDEPISPSMPGEVVLNRAPEPYAAPVELDLDELPELEPEPLPKNGAMAPLLSSPPLASSLSPESLLAIARERSASELPAVRAVSDYEAQVSSPFGASTDLSPPQVARPAFRMTTTMWVMVILLVVALLSAGAAIGLYLARM
ncbi:MAG: serine/threonine protein kinase [Deltaproteobacteria bacterium]|nr:serine/threonine protein kinase [Deltaproteobacteria bacterium]